MRVQKSFDEKNTYIVEFRNLHVTITLNSPIKIKSRRPVEYVINEKGTFIRNREGILVPYY